MARYVRFVLKGSPAWTAAAWGLLEGDQVIPLAQSPFVAGGPQRDSLRSGGPQPGGRPPAQEPEPTGPAHPLNAVRLLAPCVPSKVVGIGLNYRRHADELGFKPPERPILFLKPPTTVVGPGDPVLYPELSRQVEYEGELAVVIGREARHVSPEDAPRYILGYTCANDVTARDLQPKDGQWTVAKGFDTFCPLGPAIVTGLDPAALTVTTRVNGQVRQNSPVSDLIFGVPELVSYVSQIMTLLPGDIILTGTPAGVGPVQPGDRMEVEVSGVGTLANQVHRAG